MRTEPEGAFVSVDDYPIGYSPVATGYTYGGTREIQIEKDGYETVKVKQNLSDPWYLRPPLSFVTENFSPVEIRHQPVVDIQLEPKKRVNGEVLLQRANTLRSNVQRGTVTAPVRN
ncbi:PEGA domain-containing protein [Mariniblastus fucicola]|uniref:PEGA domain-containing protein n=1 Tax=Mariniblastus fucicola TaxID=980251 RepID=UPI0012F985FF|nr:PEGA domain-containing protein [Mariniblastus fucicola]